MKNDEIQSGYIMFIKGYDFCLSLKIWVKILVKISVKT